MINKKILLIVFLLLATILPVQVIAEGWDDASQVQQYFSGNVKDERHDWRPWALLAIAICTLANALLYILGRTLSLSSVERFAVSEFYQVTASAVMIFVLVVLADSAFGIVEMIMPQGTTTMCAGFDQEVWKVGPLGVVQCKIEEKIIYLEGLYEQAYENNKKVEPLTTACIYFMSFPVYCFDWNIDLHREMEKAHYIANRIAPLAINLHGQYMFVDYIAKNMLSVLLPLGILLRIFPVFRGIGGLFISIALAFYFVFPIAYIMLDPTTIRPAPSSIVEPLPMKEPDACFNSFSGFVDMITQPPQVQTQTQAASNSGDSTKVAEELAKMQIETFFYPLVALASSILFISAMAPLLGGDSGNIMHFLTKVI